MDPDTPLTMGLYCAHVVEAFGRESDDICMIGQAKALHVTIHVITLEISHEKSQTVILNENASNATCYRARSALQPIYLLYRPGHYDILEKD